MERLISCAICVFVLCVFFSCRKDNGVYYSSVELIVNTSCAVSGCHDASSKAGNLDCSSYTSMKTVLDNGKFEDRVLVKKDMPPAGSLSQADIDKLEQWKENGFREN